MVIKIKFFILGQYQELSWCLLGEGICLLALLDEEKANINTRKSQSTPLRCFGFAKSHCAACGSGLLQLRPHLLPLRLSPRGCPRGCSLNWQSVNTHIDTCHHPCCVCYPDQVLQKEWHMQRGRTAAVRLFVRTVSGRDRLVQQGEGGMSRQP